MDVLRRLLGGSADDDPRQAPISRRSRDGIDEDERALERYRYLLRTAPPETIEAAHAEAFAQLTPDQRRMVLQQLTGDLPEQERLAMAGAQDDSRALARIATRAEVRQPGTLERRFGGMSGPGFGMAGMMGGTFLSTIAGVMVGSAIANAFFQDSGAAGDPGLADAEGESGGLDGGLDDFGGDLGGGFGDFGGEF